MAICSNKSRPLLNLPAWGGGFIIYRTGNGFLTIYPATIILFEREAFATTSTLPFPTIQREYLTSFISNTAAG